MYGGSGTCNTSTDPTDKGDIFLMSDNIRQMPATAPAPSDTYFKTCEYANVFNSPGSLLPPRFDYTVLPEQTGAPFFLPLPQHHSG